MKEREYIMHAHEVRAILDGRKTQFRRPHYAPKQNTRPIPAKRGVGWGLLNEILAIMNRTWAAVDCPYGQPGDRLWVREMFCIVDDRGFGRERWVDYRATPLAGEPGSPAALRLVDVPAFEAGQWPKLRWRPSIHMPRWASRITLEVTGVRMERVQEISQADAWAEGVECNARHEDPRETFTRLWDSINADRGYSWGENPWVWVVEFKWVAT